MRFIFLMICLFAYGPLTGLQLIVSPEDYTKKADDPPLVFLAGSAAYPWRQEVIKKSGELALTFIDPVNHALHFHRQKERIRWEQKQIAQADILFVWIPKGEPDKSFTLSMTSLFELGRFCEMRDKVLLVGIDPGHLRSEEISGQLHFLRPDVYVHRSLETLTQTLEHYSCKPVETLLQELQD